MSLRVAITRVHAIQEQHAEWEGPLLKVTTFHVATYLYYYYTAFAHIFDKRAEH